MKIKITCLVLLVMCFSACKKDHLLDCFKSAGHTVSEFRTTSLFSNINLKNDVDLIIHPDTVNYIKVTAGDNLIDGIITELSGSTLYIRNENRCNWMRSFKNTYIVEVGMDKPVSIYYDGSGNISCMDTIRSDEFTFDSYNGSGSISFLFNCGKTHLNNNVGRTDIHAKGQSVISYIYINDVGTLDARDLETAYTYIRNSSTGDCYIKVSQELGAEIKYGGNIYYSGNPATISEQISGSGKLIPF